MRVLVLGAGVAGVATAYNLQVQGHEVTVVERRSGPGLETSFANAGHMCPSYATPWAAPGMKAKAARWIAASWFLRQDTPLRFRPRLDSHQWRWLSRWLGECNAERYVINKARMGRIARYSHFQLRHLRDRLNLDYQQTLRGNLQVFRDQQGLDQAGLAARVLADNGVPHRLLVAGECFAIEPALSRSAICGGLHLPEDETGDAHAFTRQVANWLGEHGVVFRYNTTVTGLDAVGGRVERVMTDGEPLVADAYVVSCASASVPLVASLGVTLPVLPVKGFSVTLPLLESDRGPRGGIMDESLKVAIAPMGNTLRAAGTAQIGSNDTGASERDCATPLRSITSLFPDACNPAHVQRWSGLRPMTPDGAPLVGRTPLSNLFLATGGGSNGWTTACGVGRLAADTVSGRATEIDVDEFALSRFD